MKSRALVLVLMLALVLTSMSAWARSTGEGAFLNEQAESVAEVVSQIEGNRLIALRYAKHFRSDPASVLIYMRNELSLTTLDEATTLEVFKINRSLDIVGETIELRKGTRVFVNRAGVPVLQFATGNPLSRTLITGAAPPSAAPASPDSQRLVTPGQESAQATQSGQAGQAATPTMESLTAPEASVDLNIPSVTDAPGDVLNTTTLPQIDATLPGTKSKSDSGMSSIAKWLLPAGLAGTGLALVVGGDSTSPGSTPYVPPPVSDPGIGDPGIIIPEPMGATILGSGAMAFMWMLRRRRK